MNLRSELAAWLTQYAHRYGDELQSVERMSDLLASTGNPFHRDHWSPGHFTTSAFILSPTQEQLLLILHGKLGLWLQPGGHVEPTDPSLRASAEREIAEEVGVSAPELLLSELFDLDIHTIPARGESPQHQHFDLRLLFRCPSWEVKAGSDAQGARWVTRAELETLPSDRSVLRAAGKLADLGYWKS